MNEPTNNSALDLTVDPDTTIKAGDYVRSYDFPIDAWRPGIADFYIEGTVRRIAPGPTGCYSYQIAVRRQVFDGREIRIPAAGWFDVHPPINGLRCLGGGVTRGVVKAPQPSPPPVVVQPHALEDDA